MRLPLQQFFGNSEMCWSLWYLQHCCTASESETWLYCDWIWPPRDRENSLVFPFQVQGQKLSVLSFHFSVVVLKFRICHGFGMRMESMKNLCLCHTDLLLWYNIFACWRIFLFGCFLKRKLCSILFSVFLTLLLQTSRKWGIGVGMSPVSEVAEPDVTDVRLQQSESLFQAATLREGVERHWKYSDPMLLCVSWVQD